MTRLRFTIATALIAAVTLIAPAASQAADSDLVEAEGQQISVVDSGDDGLVVIQLRGRSFSLLGWGWGG